MGPMRPSPSDMTLVRREPHEHADAAELGKPTGFDLSHDAATRTLIRRFWGVVIGIRPTLLAQTGLGPVGVDHLCRDGRAGWRVGLDLLEADAAKRAAELRAEGASVEALDALLEWIELDRHQEAIRWSHAETSLRHFVYVLANERPVRRLHDRAAMMAIWAQNLEHTQACLRAGCATLGRDGRELIKRVDGLVSRCPEADDIRTQLAGLQERMDEGLPSTLPFPLSGSGSKDTLTALLASCSRPELVV